ncbi:DMT family transporter [Alicyclobacillus acidoterrestris]|uniref:DMT family transporter n=1 Tax=Alicyclobacillus acidoterrestris TaxID=1450 RepID=UPI003F53E48F
MKAILIGILASFFFAVTFVVNKLMSDAGGSWLWSASLRYLFMLPILLILVAARGRQRTLWSEMRRHPWQWVWWSFVGFGLFYAPLCFSAAYSPAWLVAGTWQFTIIAGSLVVPLFRETRLTPQGVIHVRRRIPMKGMGMSLIILVGIAAMEWSQSTRVPLSSFLFGTIPILLATFAYPLGNRKMMELCEGRLDAYQQTLGMTIASLPLWLILAIYETCAHGLPSVNQTLQSVVVAVFSGVIATVLFFTATDLAKGNVHQLAVVEATQSGEVVFTLIGELLLIPGTSISVGGFVGLAMVILGMILHSLLSSRTKSSPHDEAIEVSS